MQQAFRFVEGWGGGPEGRTLGIASGVAVDSRDRVYVIDREPDPAIVVYDRDGNLITTWGEDVFSVPHELWIDEHDRVLVADCGDHTVRICTADGQVAQTLGTPGVPGAAGMPFNRPTRAVVAPDGEIWVADGYGQECLHRFSAAGELLATFGGRGAGPGRFTLPHSVVCDHRGQILVADREPNNRICVLDHSGRQVAEWRDKRSPCGLFVGDDGTIYLADGSLVILDGDGTELADIPMPEQPTDRPHGAHSVWVDRHGDIYVSEVGVENLVHKLTRA
jgi:DNA-binding beta-propeller fold protein YncE